MHRLALGVSLALLTLGVCAWALSLSKRDIIAAWDAGTVLKLNQGCLYVVHSDPSPSPSESRLTTAWFAMNPLIYETDLGSGWVLTLPLAWCNALLGMIVIRLAVWPAVRRRLRQRKGHCPACDYDLRGGHLCCPECGQTCEKPGYYWPSRALAEHNRGLTR